MADLSKELNKELSKEFADCEDIISRKAAIDAIGKTSDELYENIKKGATFPQRQWFDGMAQAQSILENLPSAQPEKRTEERTKKRTETHSCDSIDRQAAIDAVKKNTFRLTFAEEQNCDGHVAWSAKAVYSDVMEGALLELPSAQPEAKPPKWVAEDRYVKNRFAVFPHCQRCNAGITTGQCYCMICGQHIDWSEDDG